MTARLPLLPGSRPSTAHGRPGATPATGHGGGGEATGPVLGILGGMGPLASAAFLQTVYETAVERAGAAAEQTLPRCLLDSDPGFPDRTDTIRSRGEAAWADRLRRGVGGLLDMGATRVVVACVTAHHFVGALEPEHRRRLISLVSTTLDELAAAPAGARYLLVATDGTREAGIFQRAPRWPESAHRVVLPEPDVQRELHGLLYRLKAEPLTAALADRFRVLAHQHGCAGLIAGCTELHLLSRWQRRNGDGTTVIDPLLAIATQLTTLLSR
ncbi:aspartate/glutamate racemase family protein [Streptomyces sp. DSM 42041]|uniref:Aspartate/glutamate racemase family protein n=1 Tax=Streptomyces hazeniae TaxID=3075538 RepID=A0ABU2NUW5_9ACTN|nr:aspartate/glutamate racemase family protein [Streptomyces sp. DSM 42041]MDT0380772.1 aspartate/glutamate racemase family protein [Streptomyces sp. DSM 42041]